MVNFQSFAFKDASAEEQGRDPVSQIKVVDADDRYGKFVAEPLPQGYGNTLGAPLRRVLFSSLPGTAITWVKIDSVLHEYATIPHVKEQVSDFLLNVKGIRLKSEVDRRGKLRLEVAGQGEVSAGDIMASSEFEIVNPELHLATLDSDDANLSVEFNVERGKGYSEASRGDGLPIGVLPVDAIFSPVRKVNYKVEPVRVGHRTDFERLTLEIWTDGSIAPVDALRQAGKILVDQFFLFANAQKASESSEEGTPIRLKISPEQYNVPVERLDLSSRTLNCLKRAGIDKVGQVLEMKRSALLQIRNFGEKSLNELYDRLREMNLLPAEIDPENQQEEK
ncbi:MAG: DNA-directed RNA polymerase subunit alpha [SAR202 cluster bacterium]|nr:DNA-directed RNA polymerase subunit alpha [SAR202 cluster bacterium]